MAPGDSIDGVVCDNLDDWSLVWDEKLNPYKTVIFQNSLLEEDALMSWLNDVLRRLYDSQDYHEPTLVYTDEGMDFFGENGTSRHGSALRRNYRSGRERGLTSLTALQRPKQIQTQVLTESNLLMLFHIANVKDVDRLVEMGVPKDIEVPKENSHAFRVYRDGVMYPKQYRIKI